MALLPCPACGKQVSDQAPACPQCGQPIAAPPAQKANDSAAIFDEIKSGVGCVFLLLLAGAGYFVLFHTGIGSRLSNVGQQMTNSQNKEYLEAMKRIRDRHFNALGDAQQMSTKAEVDVAAARDYEALPSANVAPEIVALSNQTAAALRRLAAAKSPRYEPDRVGTFVGELSRLYDEHKRLSQKYPQ